MELAKAKWKPGDGSMRLRWEPGGFTPEMRIAAEVALQLRISPKYTDDGAPEGTVQRPVAVGRKPGRKTEGAENEPQLEVRADSA